MRRSPAKCIPPTVADGRGNLLLGCFYLPTRYDASVNNLQYSKTGLTLTEHFEADGGPVLTAYWDKLANVWTIGYGHTGSDVHQGLVWTPEQCADALQMDIAWAASAVNRLVTATLTQNQFDAVVDFVFNVGVGNFQKSTLLKLLNKNYMEAAALEFDKWARSGGCWIPGLLRRRNAETSLFNA